MPFDLRTFTLLHVVLSLVGIFSGLVVVGAQITGVRLQGWIGVFLATTVLANATGFGFPFVTLLPSHIVGGLSLVVLAVAIFARYGRHLAGSWRPTFAVTTVVALYLNVFVLLAQLFQKTPALLLLAPTQKEPAFALTQLLVLMLFVILGRAALRGSRTDAGSSGAAA